ncbi:MAG: hypothetical protein DRJ42_15525 [Deltaproteobacteria bacterium]|nr:MAG: hypothetical protein DRJ42_15525 [Deltaproteobacteria bacterium]
MMDAGTDGATDAGTDGAMDGGVDSALDGALDSGADADGATALVPATAPSAALSTRHGCSLGGGGLRCWGQNDLGQIGVGTASAVIVLPTDITFPAAATPRWHAAGLNHTCALADSVHCWGSNANLQLGVASGLVYQPSAVVPLPAGIVGIAAGGSHNCAWTRTSIHCWGANGEGQLGSGAPADSWMPNSLAIGGDVIQMALGDAHTCALRADGQVLCWGNNSTWELGDGTTMDRLPPTANLVTGAVSLEAGPSHTCAVLSGGGVTCWGLNDVGQLGGGAADPFRTGRGPTAVADVTAAVQVTVGAAHTCVLESGGTVKCFGSNGSGRCGAAASTFQVLDPFAPAFTGPVAAVWATAEGTCAELGAGGGTECIGNNRGGAFGFDSGAITNVGPTPVSVTW